MKTLISTIGLLTFLALKPAMGQNLVFNGDFEYDKTNNTDPDGNGHYRFPQELHIPVHYRIASGWQWCPFPIDGSTSDGRAFAGFDVGMNGSDCQRLRVIQNRTAESFMWQCISTVPGKKYKFEAYWQNVPTGTIGNPLFPWIGAFFVDGGALGNDQTSYQTNHDIVKSFVPNTGFNSPYRMQWPYDPPFIPTTLIIPNNKQIVAEHAYFYPYYEPQLNGDRHLLDFWESIYDAAGGADSPTPPIIGTNTVTLGIGMPGIGEPASPCAREAQGLPCGGAAWQTKIATGTTMIVGFFVLDAPTTTGDGTELYIDNVSVTEVVPPCPIDLDGDGDVDEADFNLFRSCASGSGVPHTASALCDKADFDVDGDVDPSDFGRFQRCYSGSGHPMPAGCCQ